MRFRSGRLLLAVVAVAALSMGCGDSDSTPSAWVPPSEPAADMSVEEASPADWGQPSLPEVPSDAVEYLFVEHPRLAFELVSEGLARLVFEDPYAPDYVLQHLYDLARAGEIDDSILDDIFRHPNAPSELLASVATDFHGEHWYVGEVLAHPHLPDEAIIAILRADPAVAGGHISTLLRNRPDLPEAELRRLSKESSSDDIRQIATDRLWEIAREG